MTLINGIEVDVLRQPRNACVDAVRNNEPLDEVLHVIVVNSNPCGYARRIKLAREFLLRMKEARNVMVYVVELAFAGQEYYITDAHNPRHLRLRAEVPLWHKENLINIGVRQLLPPHWKAMAWVDADIEFENSRWARDALRILNGCSDIVQLWSHAVDMDAAGQTMQTFESFSSHHVREALYDCKWHPGFAWAMTRRAYERTGGLYEVSILGSGDTNMATALRGQGVKSLNAGTTVGYQASLAQWEARAIGLRIGYVPGVIRHHFHGSKLNRQYNSRWTILVRHRFDPAAHLQTSAQGLLEPTPACPPELLQDIKTYFEQRKEDE